MGEDQNDIDLQVAVDIVNTLLIRPHDADRSANNQTIADLIVQRWPTDPLLAAGAAVTSLGYLCIRLTEALAEANGVKGVTTEDMRRFLGEIREVL